MGLLEFLKDIFKQEEVKENEKIKIQELETWINNKKNKDKDSLENLINQIKQKISALSNNLEEKKQILENIDLTQKKIEEKIKLIIQENLDNYIKQLEKLTVNLTNIINKDYQNIDRFIQEINLTFNTFKQKSEQSYEKATFLIGKELGETRKTIIEFSQDFNNTLKQNQFLLDDFKIISFVYKEFEKIKEIEKTKLNLQNKINETEKNINKNKLKNKTLNQEIEKIKNSDNYKKEQGKKQEIKNSKKQLEKEFYSLKELIDFKELANICHSNEKEMNIIKEYKENFQQAFEKDNERILNIINSINQTQMNKELILKKANEIILKKQNINDQENKLELKISIEILIKNSEIEKTNSEINSLNNGLEKENKRYEKNKENLNEIKNNIKEKLKEIDVELE